MFEVWIHGYGIGTVHPSVLEQMYCLRNKVFNERLGWKVESHLGKEKDWFDQLSPIYILVLDKGIVVGTARLLCTTGPYMLRDIFTDLLDTDALPNSPNVWESTRFAMDMGPVRHGYGEKSRAHNQQQLSSVTSYILAGMWELALKARFDSIISVYNTAMHRILTRAGCEIKILGRSDKYGKPTVLAGSFAVSRPILQRICEIGNIAQPVLTKIKTPDNGLYTTTTS